MGLQEAGEMETGTYEEGVWRKGTTQGTAGWWDKQGSTHSTKGQTAQAPGLPGPEAVCRHGGNHP